MLYKKISFNLYLNTDYSNLHKLLLSKFTENIKSNLIAVFGNSV